MRRSAVSIPFPGPYPSLCHPDTPGLTFNKETGWGFHGAPENMNFALPFGTVGGDMYGCIAEFNGAHYEQTNTALNKKIWGDLPLTMAELEKLEQDTDVNLENLRANGEYVHFDRELFQSRIFEFEATRTKASLGVLLRLLSGADTDYLPTGNPRESFLQKAQAEKFESLSSAITRTKRLVDVIDRVYTAQGKHSAAAARYALAILELYPWVSSPNLFTSDKAFEGIAPLSLDLWVKLGNACVSHAQGLLGQDDSAAASWAQDALRVAQISVSERFTTRGKLFEAFEVMTIAQLLSATPAERRAWSADACSSAQAEAKLRNGQALMSITWAALFLVAEFRTHCKRKDSWAHADCLMGHSCGTYGNFLNFMQWEPAQAHVHHIGQLAIHYEPRPCGFKDGIPSYCARGACAETPKEFYLAI